MSKHRSNGADHDETDDGPKPGEMRVLATDNGDTSVDGQEQVEGDDS